MFKHFFRALIVLALFLTVPTRAQQEQVFTNISGTTLPGLFTTAADSISYLNRGMAGWSLKPGSIILLVDSADDAQGIWTDDGNGTLTGSYVQVPEGAVFSSTGVINYQTGAWAIFLPEPFLGPAQASYSYFVRQTHSPFIYNDYLFTDLPGPTLPGIFTTVADSVSYLNRGMAGWSLKPGSIMLVLDSDNGAQGIWTDDGNGALIGNYAQAPGGAVFSSTGVINYQTGAWEIFLPEPFLGPAQASYSYVVRMENRPFINNFDNTGRSHCTIYDRFSGRWYAQTYTGDVSLWGTPFGGFRGAVPITGDYDGDGQADLGVYDSLGGKWYVRDVVGEVILWDIDWGFSGAVAVSGDYDGDGRSDLAVYEAASGKWYVRDVAGKVILWGSDWGFPGAVAVSGDYNGDGRSDLAVYDASSGKWYVRDVAGKVILWGTDWGFPGAVAVPGDYDGDGTSDLAVYEAASGKWYVRDVAGNVILWGINWGGFRGAVPVGFSL